MHSVHEYAALLQKVLTQAETMTNCLPEKHAPQAIDVLGFIKQFGCHGMPSDEPGVFLDGSWLTGHGRPARQYFGITIVPCFSDDVSPVAVPDPERYVAPGNCLTKEQAIFLHNVDHWSVPELALTLLHEARHARHRIGPRLAGLTPLDSDEIHETNTWLFTLNVLAAWGGSQWSAAVRQEITWLEEQGLAAPATRVVFAGSGHYWPEFDSVFGLTNHKSVRMFRQRLGNLQANMEYWSQQKGIPPESLCHAVVSSLYK